jgi:endo-1,4-beta-xylanase
MGYHRGSALPFSNYQPKSFYNDIISLAKKVGPGDITTNATTTTNTTNVTTTTTDTATTSAPVDLKETF